MGRALLLLLMVTGCSVFDPGLIDAFDTGNDPGDAGEDAVNDLPDAGEDAPIVDAGDDSGTGRRIPPSRPAASTEGTSVDPILLALRDVQLNQDGDRWREIGFDLDGQNTQAPEYAEKECVPPAEDAEPEIDGEGGIDNAFGHRLYPLISLAIPGFEASARENQAAGFGAILLQLADWNGEDDDPRVDVIFTQSAGGTSAPSDEVRFEGDELVLRSDTSAAPPPAWDGEDAWWSRSDGFFEGQQDMPLIRDNNAFVSAGRLVMRLPERAEFLFFDGRERGVRVRLTDATAMIDLRMGDTFGESVIAGRWRLLDLLDTGENIGLCFDTSEREIVDSQLRMVGDVRSMAGSGGEGVICDAMSVGVTFQARLGRYVGLGPSVPLPNPCAEP